MVMNKKDPLRDALKQNWEDDNISCGWYSYGEYILEFISSSLKSRQSCFVGLDILSKDTFIFQGTKYKVQYRESSWGDGETYPDWSTLEVIE